MAFVVASVPCEANARQVSTNIGLSHELTVGGETFAVTYAIVPFTDLPSDLPFTVMPFA